MIKEKEFYDKALTSQRWVGKVEDVKDPKGEGRIKVRVFGVHGDKISTKDLPWCYPDTTITSSSSSGGSFYSVPKKGSLLEVRFTSDDPYSLTWTRHLHLSKAVKDEVDGDEKAAVLWYDVDTKLSAFYTQEKGLMFSLDKSFINITPENEIKINSNNARCSMTFGNDGELQISADNINVLANEQMRTTTPELNLEGMDTNIGAAPIFSAVAAEILWAFLKGLSAGVDQKWPPTPGVFQALAEAAEAASTSNTVKLSL